MRELEAVDVRTHPLNNVFSAANTTKVPASRNLQDDYAITVVEGTDAKQPSDDSAGR